MLCQETTPTTFAFNNNIFNGCLKCLTVVSRWAKFIEDSCYSKRPPPTTFAFNNNILNGCLVVISFEPNSLRNHGIQKNNDRKLRFPKVLFKTLVAWYLVMGQTHWQNVCFGEASFATIFISSTSFSKTTMTTIFFISRLFVRFCKSKHGTLFARSHIFENGWFLALGFAKAVSWTNNN